MPMNGPHYEERAAKFARELTEHASGTAQTSNKALMQIGAGVILALLAVAHAIDNAATR